ncbi:choline uptake/conversion transcriptional regulator CudC [Halobacillus litoralis]|uniref:choline uptake/conversion transcriptional regulator CudC n=1 Tax=Halobacillus litoralis TaxID=45668 RepID=UPI00136A2DE8|nr:GbsR/MarR family transcriptional regulator [Halobacillus litoralis]MYL37458.1 GbsR/MarR family transcriptional regulator [Halobacillus litoralis]
MKRNLESRIEEAESAVVNSIAETMDLYGITPSTGRLFARMYFKHEPMTLDDMKDDLGMSKPSMSIAVRNLQEVSIIHKVWRKGSRKDSFMAEKNFFKYFSRFFGSKWEREAKLNLSAIDYAGEILQQVMEDEEADEATVERARINYEQLEDYRKYCKWLERLSDSIDSGEIFDFLPVEEPDADSK